MSIRWLPYEKTHSLQFKFRETLNPKIEFYSVDLSKKAQGLLQIKSITRLYLSSILSDYLIKFPLSLVDIKIDRLLECVQGCRLKTNGVRLGYYYTY